MSKEKKLVLRPKIPTLKIIAFEKSWIRLKDQKGDIYFERNLNKDEEFEIPNELLNLIYVVTIRILAIQSNVRSISQQGSNTIVQMNNPIEGARILLQRQLNGLALVGNAQIRLKISKNWQTELTQVMEKLSSFKHFTDSLK